MSGLSSYSLENVCGIQKVYFCQFRTEIYSRIRFIVRRLIGMFGEIFQHPQSSFVLLLRLWQCVRLREHNLSRNLEIMRQVIANMMPGGSECVNRNRVTVVKPQRNSSVNLPARCLQLGDNESNRFWVHNSSALSSPLAFLRRCAMRSNKN